MDAILNPTSSQRVTPGCKLSFGEEPSSAALSPRTGKTSSGQALKIAASAAQQLPPIIKLQVMPAKSRETEAAEQPVKALDRG
jgi:hypothetical protein